MNDVAKQVAQTLEEMARMQLSNIVTEIRAPRFRTGFRVQITTIPDESTETADDDV